MKALIKKIKAICNDISYNLWLTRIMSDAMEYDIEPNIVNSWLKANYENHYGKGEQ